MSYFNICLTDNQGAVYYDAGLWGQFTGTECELFTYQVEHNYTVCILCITLVSGDNFENLSEENVRERTIYS